MNRALRAADHVRLMHAVDLSHRRGDANDKAWQTYVADVRALRATLVAVSLIDRGNLPSADSMRARGPGQCRSENEARIQEDRK